MTPTLTATQARELAMTQRNEVVIAPYLAYIHTRIHEAAMAGRTSLPHPLRGASAMAYPSRDEQTSIWNALRAQGYEVIHHPDPDPGHPGSVPYDEVKW